MPRDFQRNPGAVGHVFAATDVGADKRHEEHQSPRERDEHSGDVGALRNPGSPEELLSPPSPPSPEKPPPPPGPLSE